MQVELKVQHTDLTEAFRDYIERKLRFAFRRFGDRIGRVEVKVSNDPRAPTAKRCHITAEMKPFGRVSAEASRLDLHAAINRATGRLGRVFARRLARAQELRLGREIVRAA